MSKILITGGSSLLGKSLFETLPEEHEFYSTWYTNPAGAWCTHQMDVTNKSQVLYIFDRIKPDIVIHCAANGSVDYAQKNYQEVHTVNVGGTQNILAAAHDYESKVIFISSNAVYDGDQPPYTEKDFCAPVNVYGSIKRQSEREVALSRHWVIIRPFLLYGWPAKGGRQNWATTILDVVSGGNSIKLVDDTIWQPTYAPDCARAIWRLMENDNEIYNVASPEQATLYKFGQKVARSFGLDASLVKPIGSDAFPTMAKRPKDTSYSLDKIIKAGISMMDLNTGLEEMKKAGMNEL